MRQTAYIKNTDIHLINMEIEKCPKCGYDGDEWDALTSGSVVLMVFCPQCNAKIE